MHLRRSDQNKDQEHERDAAAPLPRAQEAFQHVKNVRPRVSVLLIKKCCLSESLKLIFLWSINEEVTFRYLKLVSKDLICF